MHNFNYLPINYSFVINVKVCQKIISFSNSFERTFLHLFPQKFFDCTYVYFIVLFLFVSQQFNFMSCAYHK